MLVGSSRQPERDGRRDREDLATLGLYQLPSALVDHPVMSGAQEDEVFQLVPAAVHRIDEVVSIAPRGGPLTTGPPAVPITGDERPPLGSSDRRLGATDVDH